MIKVLTLQALDLARSMADTQVLLSMFEARKSVFVDLLKWDVPVLDDRYEVDRFDDRLCRYVIVADEDGRHLASARLLPTTRPHILGDIYAPLCEGPIPRGCEIFEITRFCLDRRLGATRRREARDSLVCALVDHALATRIETFTAVAETGWFRKIERFGWDCRALGSPRRIDGHELRAIRIAIHSDTPARLATSGIVPSGHDVAGGDAAGLAQAA